ncbi:MAG: hypothetical protein ACE5FF_01810 [Saprospiraceae bacterium]
MKAFYLPLLFGLSLFFCACGIISQDDPCGPAHDDFQRFNNGGTLFGIDEPSNTYVQDGNRVFQWTTPLYENVCPKEHVNILATFQLEPNPMLPIETRIIAAYAFFLKRICR